MAGGGHVDSSQTIVDKYVISLTRGCDTYGRSPALATCSDKPFPLKHSPHIVEARRNVTSRESNLPEPMDVRELGTPLLQKHHCSTETEATLEEANLMNSVVSE